jgi:alpha-glucoside transport system substrate-binding protein
VAKRRVRPLAVACLALVLAALGLSACTSRAQPETLTVLGPWKADPATGIGGERAAFLAMVQPFEARNNVRVRYESPPDPDAVLTARLRGGTPPDLVGLSDYGELLALSADHSLQPLEGVVDLPRLRDEYGTWLSLGQSGGHQMAIVIKVALKGLVWYSKPAFAAAGYQPPQDWTAALALAGRMSARYGAAWCLGLEAGSTSGWPGTDWLEDILLDQAGPVVYDKWARVRLPWTSPEVRRAWQTWGQLLAAPRAVAGGRLGALVTNYVSADQSLLASPVSSAGRAAISASSACRSRAAATRRRGRPAATCSGCCATLRWLANSCATWPLPRRRRSGFAAAARSRRTGRCRSRHTRTRSPGRSPPRSPTPPASASTPPT